MHRSILHAIKSHKMHEFKCPGDQVSAAVRSDSGANNPKRNIRSRLINISNGDRRKVLRLVIDRLDARSVSDTAAAAKENDSIKIEKLKSISARHNNVEHAKYSFSISNMRNVSLIAIASHCDAFASVRSLGSVKPSPSRYRI